MEKFGSGINIPDSQHWLSLIKCKELFSYRVFRHVKRWLITDLAELAALLSLCMSASLSVSLSVSLAAPRLLRLPNCSAKLLRLSSCSAKLWWLPSWSAWLVQEAPPSLHTDIPHSLPDTARTITENHVRESNYGHGSKHEAVYQIPVGSEILCQGLV